MPSPWLLFSLFPLAVIAKLDLCAYLQLLGGHSPDCQSIPMLRRTEAHRRQHYLNATNDEEEEKEEFFERIRSAINKKRFIEAKQKMKLCTGKYHDCKSDALCDSGYSCSASFVTTKPKLGQRYGQILPGNGPRCCLPNDPELISKKVITACPDPKKLNFVCSVNKPTSWCHKHSDCSSSPTQLCCPTGCDYNICMASAPLKLDTEEKRQKSTPNCPPSKMLDVHCNRPRTTNWCEKHQDCEVENVQEGREYYCCPTDCNYNMCVTKKNGAYNIGR